jgi:DNA primase
LISEQKISEVRGAARISEFVSPYVSLKRSGRGFLGLCPFHGEKTPSFSVSDEGGFYHCFGCGAGGNVFKFVMQMENVTFPEAVRKVAAHYGIEVPEEGGARGATSERDAALAALSAAARFYRDCLARGGFGQTVRDYLAGRGILEAAHERFLLGAAPPGGEELAQHLKKERHDLRVAERIGLVGLRSSTPYDRFRGRLMFPIRDTQGRTVGFGARRIGEGDGPKYLNSSDSPVYHKGRVLYGLFEAREARRRAPGSAPADSDAAATARDGELVLVEGYLDVIAMSQGGLVDVVAGCGTALTVDQARLMRRQTSDVVALFDGDDAGRRAAARSFPVFVEAGIWPRGVFLPEDEDPDTFVRRQGADALRAKIAKAKPLVEAYARYVADVAGSAGGPARVGAQVADVLRKVENPFEYDDFVRKAALWTGISERVLREQARPAARPAATDRDRASLSLASGPPGAEELLLSVFLSDPSCIDRLERRVIVSWLRTEPWASIAADIFAARDSVGGFVPGEVLAGLDDALRGRLARRLNDDPTFADPAARERVLVDCMDKLRSAAEEQGKRRMLAELRRLEEIGDEAGAAALLERWTRARAR